MESITVNSYLFQLLFPVEKKNYGKYKNHSRSNYQQKVRKSEVNNNIYSSVLFAALVLGNMLTCRGAVAGCTCMCSTTKNKTERVFATQANCKTQL